MQHAPQSRPLSPHLQIYKPQLTSILSIMHRLTGVALTCGAFFLVYWLYHVAEGEMHYLELQQVMISPLGRVFLISWSFALFYHLLNGIRHLLWDAGYGLELRDAYASGYVVIVFSVVLTVLFWGVMVWL